MKHFVEINRASTEAKQNLNLKSSFCAKLKFLLLLAMICTLGVGEVWGVMANVNEGSYIYIDVTNCSDWASSCSLKMNWFDSRGNSKGNYIGAEYYTTNIYRFLVPSDGIGGFQIVRLNPNDHSQQYNYSGKMYAKNRSYDSQNCLCAPGGAVTNNATFTWSVYHPYTYVYDGNDNRVSQVVNNNAANKANTYIYSWKDWGGVDEKEFGNWRGGKITPLNGLYAYYVTEGRNYILNCYNGNNSNQTGTLYATKTPSESHHHNDGTYYWNGGANNSDFYGTGIKIEIVSNAYELYVGESTTFTINAVSPLTGLSNLEIWEDGVKLSGTPSGSGTSRTFSYTPTTAGMKSISARIHFTFNNQAIYLCAADMKIRVYEKYKIKVQNTLDWDCLKLHMFRSADNDIKNSAWPGDMVTEFIYNDGSHDWYFVTLDSKFDRFMFANSDASKQTYSGGMSFDKATYEDNCYILEGNSNTNNWTTKVDCPEFYRIKSVCTGGTYYSNILMSSGKFSLYATTSGTLTLQHLVGSVWTDKSSTITRTGITKDSVYVADFNGSNVTNNFVFYNGDYYLHCNATTTNFLINGEGREGTTGTKFTYFEPNVDIFPDELYNHYWVDWFPAGQSVIATIGNDYNDNLANQIGTDAYAPDGVTVKTDPSDDKEWGGNVRFGYNPKTNYFSRSIIAGAGSKIKLQGAKVTPGGGSEGSQGSFTDASGWVYTIAASAKGEATASVTTSYNGAAATLVSDKKLIAGSSSTSYNVVITYDFKTNRLLAAWKPNAAFGGFDLESNLLVERIENGAPTVLNLTTENTALTKISKIYTAIKLLQNNWIAGTSNYRVVSGKYIDEYYWISFPYDCKISEIFGIEGYGDSWVIQTYHGDYRAEKGWWKETSSWWYNMGRDGVLNANQGYVLRVTNLNGDNNVAGLPKRFAGASGGELFLYFPSAGSSAELERLGNTTTTTAATHTCTQVRDAENHAGDPNYDRRAIDSNWNIIGSPSFNKAKITTDGWGATYPTSPNVTGTLKFFYTWNKTGYTITNAKGYAFEGTHAYLAQYAGTISWAPYTNNSTDPLVGLKNSPARYQEEEEDPTYELVIKRDGEQEDVTYITRMAEGATEGYDLNLDLSKLINKNSTNLYTMAGYYKMAGNCLPEEVETVPVGVQIATTGEYTFSIPEGTNGVGVTLFDNVTGERTNLGLTDYTTALEAGTYEDRFVLELSPVAQVPTEIENSEFSIQNSGVRKVMIDGALYIVKDGVVFDARGQRVE